MNSPLKNLIVFTIITTFFCGCATNPDNPTLPDSVIKYKQPTIAVLAFDNKAGFYKNLRLGEGFREVLVNELISSKRYNVVTRYDLDSVISELNLQTSELMTEHGKAKRGRLQNVQYLIKGTITDFSHTAGGTLRWVGSSLGIGGDGSVAQVSVILSVIEVETGEIIASVSLNGTATAMSIEAKGVYNNMIFGGSAFSKTPLGEATAEVISKCLKEITASIAREKWQPTVIKAASKIIYITGGKERDIQIGSFYQGIKRGEPLLDPETGAVLGHEESTYTGRVKVIELDDKFAKALIISGNFEPGDYLVPFIPPQPIEEE